MGVVVKYEAPCEEIPGPCPQTNLPGRKLLFVEASNVGNGSKAQRREGIAKGDGESRTGTVIEATEQANVILTWSQR